MDRAINTLTNSLKSRPERWETRRALIDLLLESGKGTEAVRVFQEAPEIPKNRETALLRMRLVQAVPGAFVTEAKPAPKVVVEQTLERQPVVVEEPEVHQPVPETPVAAPAEKPAADAVVEPKPAGGADGRPEEKPAAAKPDAAAEPGTDEEIKKRVEAEQAAREAEEKRVKRERWVSMAASVVIHVLIAAALAAVVVKLNESKPVESISAMNEAPADDGSSKAETVSIGVPSAGGGGAVVSGMVATDALSSAVSLPVPVVSNAMDSDISTIGIGEGMGIGTFGGGGGGSAVHFFGGVGRGKRVAFLVDFSASMLGSIDDAGKVARIDLLKAELMRSLRTSVTAEQYFSVIYFAGPAWLGGQTPNFDREKRPKAEWVSGTPQNRAKVFKEVEAMKLGDGGLGTAWCPALKVALALDPKPEVIFLLTDGDADDADDLEKTLKDGGADNIAINTIVMGEPGEVSSMLAEVARTHRGKYSVIVNGRTYVGYDAEKFNKKRKR